MIKWGTQLLPSLFSTPLLELPLSHPLALTRVGGGWVEELLSPHTHLVAPRLFGASQSSEDGQPVVLCRDNWLVDVAEGLALTGGLPRSQNRRDIVRGDPRKGQGAAEL